ncbi:MULTISPECIES: endolytic transglycosylase MltG [Gammaproteobacteria]|uniref:endolytic transglycosylase MltG n=1 Tax=Gammaproteobacteria TaxID=1236 RepID=UPI0014039D8A|nr:MULTISPECIES: endolytic transglycosylase MltG [Gammaproteobacteria]
MFRIIKVTFVIGLVLGIALIATSYFYLKNVYEQEISVGDDVVYFEIEPGFTARKVLNELEKVGVVKSAEHAYLASRIFTDISQLHAGVYSLPESTSLASLWRMFSNGEQHLFSITFAEGLNFKEWREIIAQHPWLELEWDGLSAQEVARQLELPFSAGHPEGLLHPNTYRFHAYTSDAEIYRQAAQQMETILEELWQNRQEGLPIQSPYEALILASIVEKETGADGERSLVASVFVNRLNRGMRLQSDPTIIYGLGERYRGVIYRSDIQEHTAYNTYRINRLPPTPIAMPGRAALEATLNPPQTDYYYFVSRNDGTHVFSKSLIEHNRAVQQYQRN